MPEIAEKKKPKQNPPPPPPPPGNKRGTKLKDPNIRQQAYEQYCAHLAKGKSKRSWCFEHPELTCTWETMEKYLEDSAGVRSLKKENSRN